MHQKVWIVLVDYNGMTDTRKCLSSLRQLTNPASIVVIDNASDIEVAPQLQPDFSGVHFVRSAENGGWAGGNNAGIKFALDRGAEFIILLNNDTMVAPNFVNRLITAFYANPDFGILGPVIRFMDSPCEVQTEGVLFNRPGQPGFFQRIPVPLTQREPPKITEVDIVNGCCLALCRSVVEKIGLVDERFFLIHEESDLCLRAKDVGFRCGIIDHALVWHKGSSSFKRTGLRTQRYYDARNLQRLLMKHGKRKAGRGWLSSKLQYWNYVYYRYMVEKENGCSDAAEAVLEGVYDGMLGKYDKYQLQKRLGVGLLRAIFAARGLLRRQPKKQQEELVQNAAVVR